MEKSLTLELHKLFNSQRRFKYPLEKEEKNAIPKNGIYIFFEKGETITTPDGRILDRIVRVGTHKKDDNLYKRLNQHFTGNITSSIFRKDIGKALSTDNEEEISKYMRESLFCHF